VNYTKGYRSDRAVTRARLLAECRVCLMHVADVQKP
jgi:hypothetical protein